MNFEENSSLNKCGGFCFLFVSFCLLGFFHITSCTEVQHHDCCNSSIMKSWFLVLSTYSVIHNVGFYAYTIKLVAVFPMLYYFFQAEIIETLNNFL